LPRPRLSDEQIIAEYAAGKPQAWIGLKARLSTAQVRAILVAHGVHIRGQQEALRLSIRSRARRPASA
jgi:hypothetical protein